LCVSDDDVVLAYRPVNPTDRRLLALMAQLTPDEVKEAIDLLRDLIADRGRQAPMREEPRHHTPAQPPRYPVD
jgi:hypothetical protein